MVKIVISEELSLVAVRMREQNRIAEFIRSLAAENSGRFGSLLECLMEHWPQRQLYYLLN